MNVPGIFLSKGKKVHPRLRVNHLVNRHQLPEGSCVIPNKAACMDDETWVKAVILLSPGIRKMKVSNAACVLPILLSIYLTLHIFPFKLSADDM